MRVGVGLRLAHTPVCTAANLQGYDPGELVQVFGAEACQHPRTNALLSSSLLTYQSSTAAHESIESIAVSRKLSSCVHEVRV